MDSIIISTLGSTVFSALEPILESTIGAFLGNHFHELNGIHREQKKPAQQAMKDALEEWLIAIMRNLSAQEYQEEELQQFSLDYQQAFKKFLHDPQVVEELLQPFFAATTDYRIDSKLLMQRWTALNLPQLPAEFDLASVNRAYLRRLKKAGIVRPELRALFLAQLAQERTHHLQAIRGVWPDFDLEQYIKRVRQKYQVLELSALTPPARDDVGDNPLKLKDVFVPPMVRASRPPRELPKEIWQQLQAQGEISSEIPDEWQVGGLEAGWESWMQAEPEPVLVAVAKPANNRMILLGDPGAGKSSLARYLLLSLLDENAPLVKDTEVFTDCLPLLVELRHYLGWIADNKGGNFLEYFHYLGKAEEYGLNHLELKPLLNTQKTLVIFDGLDEIFAPAQRENVTQAIIGFALNYEKARVLVTSRIIGYHGEALRAADFHEYTLQDFELAQIKTFAQGWFNLVFPNKPEEAAYRYQRIEMALQNSPAIQQLAGNPLLLTMIAIIAKHQELPRERTKLYEHATKVLCHHWDVTGHKIPVTEMPADFMREDDKLELLRQIAWRMQTSAKGLAGNFILGDDLHDEIAHYLRIRWQLPATDIGRMSQVMITQLRARNFILCLYGAQVYGFVHRTFLEYFCASEIVYRFEKEQTLSFEQLKTEVFLAHFQDETWHEILQLICGLLAPRIVGPLVEMLVSSAKMADETGLKKVKFAQTCLNEVNDIKQIESTVQSLYLKWKEFVDHKDWFVRSVVVESLAEYYHERPETYSLLEQLIQNNKYEEVRRAAFESLAKHYHQRPKTYSLLRQVVVHDENEWVRRAAVKSLAKHYHEHGETYSLLRQVVVNDEDQLVRRAAVKSLVEYYHQRHETYSLLLQIMVNDKGEKVRSAMVESLVEYYHQRRETYSLLQRVVVNDEAQLVRSSAVKSLVEHYHQRRETYSLLQQVVVNDKDETVRSATIESLVKHYHQRRKTYSLLQQVVVNDEDKDIRRAAIESLVKHYYEHPKTYSWLLQLIQNHEYEEVRCAAVKSLAKYYHERRQTYSLLEQVIVNDKDQWVRSTAVESLVEHYHQRRETYLLLLQVVVNDGHEWVRRASVKAIAENDYEEIWQRLLSEDFHCSWLWQNWLDSKALINQKRVRSAAKALKLPPKIIRQHYEEIAKEIPLRLAWRLEPDLTATIGLGEL